MANLRGRLWGGDSSSSDSESSSSEDEAPQTQVDQGKKRVVWAEESSSDEDDQQTKRKVVSHADKRYDQIKEVIKKMKNHQKVGDFAQITTGYESFLKMYEKMKNTVEAENGGPPNFFVKTLTDLDVYCETTHAEHQKAKEEKGTKLPENKAKAFNTLRAKVRKGNKNWQDLIEKCKESPEEFDAQEEDAGSNSDSSNSSNDSGSGSDSSSSSGSDSDSDSSSSSGSDSDSDSDSGSDSSSSDSDEGSFKTGGSDSDSDDDDEEAQREKKMLRWLITPERQKKIDGKEKKMADQAKDGKDRKTEKQGKERNVKSKAVAQEKDAGKKEKEEYTPEQLKQKIQEILQMRGRRGFVRKEYMEKLEQLEEHAVKQGPRARLFILTAMISADFDNTGSAFEAMRINMWIDTQGRVMKMLPLMVEAHKNEQEGIGEEPVDEEDPRNYNNLQQLFVSFVEKLDDELYKALQLAVDVYGTEYQDILANSGSYLKLLKQVMKFFEDTKQVQPLGLMSLRLLEQLYYKPNVLNRAVFESIRFHMPEDQKDDWVWPEDSKSFITNLCKNVFPNGKPLLQRNAVESEDAEGNPVFPNLHKRAALYHAYYLALHDDFQAARNLLHLGNFQEIAMESDVHMQILYNRVLAQLGLCAFRLGKIQEAHTYLMDVCMHNKARELLAQGLSFSRYNEKTPEQERAEKMRQLPYHMHINLEVLESAHRICAMLLEVPNLAMQSIDPTSKRIISRVLRRALDDYDKKVFVGPPEDAKEAVVYAAKALQRGDWQTAVDAIEDLKIWDHIDPGDAAAGTKVKAMTRERIQTEALRTYLFTYASIYDTFELERLVGMFGLETKLVHSIISKMMIKEEITAFWDESSTYVLMQHSEPTPLQRLALTLAERGAQAVDNNEKMFDSRSGMQGLSKEGGPGQGRFDQIAPGQGKGRFGGKGGGMDGKGGKGSKGRGKGSTRPVTNRGWENARAGAVRGTAQRGWATNVNN